MKYIENEFNGRPQLGKLKKGHLKENKDIAAMFKLFFNLGFFDNNLEEVASVVSNVFDIKYDTIKNYLKNPAKLEAQDLALAKQLYEFLKQSRE